jgi:transposase, IS6 family
VRRPRAARLHIDRSAFAGFRFPPEVITVAVRWYLRYSLSYRDVEELLAERGIEVDHVTVYRWVQRFTLLFADAARPLRTRPGTGGSWTRPTSRSPAGGGTCTGRSTSTGRLSTSCYPSSGTPPPPGDSSPALAHGPAPVEVTTDKAGPYLRVLDELVSAAAHVTEQYGNNRIEADHGRLKARLRPMRGLKRFRSAARIAAGHAFVQNLRRGHYELATDISPPLRLATAFSELALAM